MHDPEQISSQENNDKQKYLHNTAENINKFGIINNEGFLEMEL